MMEENRNFILAIVLTMIILFGWEFFYGAPMREAEEQAIASQVEATEAGVPVMAAAGVDTPGGIPGMSAPVVNAMATDRAGVISGRNNVMINSDRLIGTISLKGLRFDDLSLKDYRVAVEADSEIVKLLNPSDAFKAYFADFGWIGEGTKPDGNSVWSASKTTLGADDTVSFTWDNGEGLIFSRDVSLDNDYMFTVTQRVQNNTDAAVALATYGRVYKEGRTENPPLFILHEGPIRVGTDGKEEISFDDLEDDTYEKDEVSDGGWAGITEKEWLVAVIPDQSQDFVTNVSRTEQNGGEQFHVNFATSGISIAPGTTGEKTAQFFAGAKEVALLEKYTEDGVRMFDYAIDWGWFYFITKPIYYGLSFFYGIVGNFGIAILLLTIVVKGLLFPMANKQYESMGKMKKLQPKMAKLKEKFGDDRARMQQETMKMYKEESVNPLASCLPIFIQIPIFFSLYKVLYVTIDMRHAPFFGWIKDLSAPDPMLVTNLFGLIPWEPTGFLAIGILPVFMGVTMFLQQKLNPPMTDPIQQKVFALMPIMFTFILAGFSVGLVIYWTWNNILTICQQWFIMRRVAALDDGPEK